MEFTFNSVEDYEVTVKAPGRNTNITRSGLSKTKGTSCLSTKSAKYMLNKKKITTMTSTRF
jgi:hypothetical protein